MPDEVAAGALGTLRREIDRIDEAMHRLLMERGAIIDQLIAAKGTSASGSAFRPEREAAMTRVLAARHEGRLPVEAIEAIWRVIISTFTYVQAPFGVHSDTTLGEAAMRDSARFHFGFTVPYTSHRNPEAVIAAVGASRGDLGLVGLEPEASGAWWRALEPPDAPKIIARLPFGLRAGHPAATPVLVLSKTISGEGLGAVLLHSAPSDAISPAIRSVFDAKGAQVIAASDGAALLSGPRDMEAATIATALGNAARHSVKLVGSHPALKAA